MTQPHLLDRGVRSHPRNPKHFTLILLFHTIKESRSEEAPTASWALGMESEVREGERWAFLPGTTHRLEQRGCGWIGRPRRCSVMRLHVDAQPQAHPGSNLREAACSALNTEAIVVGTSARRICSEQLPTGAQHKQCN